MEFVSDIDKNEHEYALYKQHELVSDLDKSLAVVVRFISEKQRVLVGGMSIDFALKLKGDKLYPEHTVPDYDFLSPDHYNDAVDIAKELHRLGIKDITVIPAMHISTVKVRVGFEVVADISFIPPALLEKFPTMRCRDIIFISPFMQMIDQLRMMSFPYENPPREAVFNRLAKDFKRYTLLAEYYRLEETPSEMQDVEIPIALLHGNCITGWAAYCYYSGNYVLAKDTLKISHPKGMPVYVVTLDLDHYDAATNPKGKYTGQRHYPLLDKVATSVHIQLESGSELCMIDGSNDPLLSEDCTLGSDIEVAQLQHAGMLTLMQYIIFRSIGSDCFINIARYIHQHKKYPKLGRTFGSKAYNASQAYADMVWDNPKLRTVLKPPAIYDISKIPEWHRGESVFFKLDGSAIPAAHKPKN